MLSVYVIRYLLCFIVYFLLLILYFSITKPPYIIDEKYKIDNITNITSVISIKLLLVYSFLYSSIISLVFMVIGIIYQYYF